MKLFISELQYLCELYPILLAEFSRLDEEYSPQCPGTVIQWVLRNRDLLKRIDEITRRMSRLAAEWNEFGPLLDSDSKQQILSLVSQAKNQAMALNDYCALYNSRLEDIRKNIGQGFSDLRDGTRYLAGLKPIKNNYPKFVDSLC